MRRLTIPGVAFLFAVALVLRPVSLVGQDQQPDGNIKKASAVAVIVGNPLGPDGTAHPEFVTETLVNNWLAVHAEPERPRGFGFTFSRLSESPEGHMLGVISVQGRSDPEEMLTFIEDVLNRAMREIHDRLRRGPLLKKLEAASRREMRANQRVMELTDHLRDRQELARENGVALEPDDPQLLVSVKRDNLALRAELAGLRAQQKAITEQTYVATDRLAAGKTDEDLIREGLQKVLKLRQEERARLLQLCESGHASELEVTQAEVAIAKAEADLAEFRRMQAQQFESGPLGRLNERLVETRIAISTAQARLEETDKAIEQLERSSYDPANPLVMEVQQARREMDSAWAELQAAFAERARLAAACEALPSPEVILIRKP